MINFLCDSVFYFRRYRNVLYVMCVRTFFSKVFFFWGFEVVHSGRVFYTLDVSSHLKTVATRCRALNIWLSSAWLRINVVQISSTWCSPFNNGKIRLNPKEKEGGGEGERQGGGGEQNRCVCVLCFVKKLKREKKRNRKRLI